MVKVVRDGKTYIDIKDYDRLRELFGELLREVQRIKSQGDYDAAKALVEGYGVKVDPGSAPRKCWTAWRCWAWLLTEDSSTQRCLPFATLKDNIESVEVSYPDDFTGQMLHYSEQFSFLPDVN